jgi:endonuclease/exonuclease/phosphatase (EEP) superfamily protein YafD
MIPTDHSSRRQTLSLLGLFEVVCVMALLATFAGFFARAWWLLELTTHFRPHLAITCLLLAGFWAWRRRWRWVAGCVGGLILNMLVMCPHFLAGPVSPASGSSPLRIVSLNVHTSNPQAELVVSFLSEANADIVLLMEVDDLWMQKLAEWSAQYPYQLVEAREDNFGIAVFSRVPWTNAAVAEFGSAGVPTVVADLNVSGRSIHFVGTHPLPPGTASYSAQRNEQLEKLAEHMTGITNPIVLVGDLNTTPWSPCFTELQRRSGLHDASKGTWISGSWPATLPVGKIPIDHCLISPELRIVSRKLGPPVGSDHLPLIWTLAY